MANLAGTYNSSDSYYPKLAYAIEASQVGRDSTSVTYRFKCTVSVRSGGGYGYDLILNYNIGGVTGTKTIKTTSGGFPSNTGTFDIKVSGVSAAGGTNTVKAKMWSSSSNDSTHWQNSFNTGDRYLDTSSFNRPPVMSTSAPTLSPSGTIPENTSSIKVTSPSASDPDNNISGYRCRVSVNGGGYTEVYRGAANNFNHNVSGYGEGTRLTYLWDCYDSYGSWSGSSGTATATKNTLNNGGFTGHSNDVSFDTTSFTLNFSRGSNTNGSTVYMACYSDNVTVHNMTELTSGTSQTISIWRSGAYPSGPYIKFDDLKAFFQNGAYNGRLHVGLRTRNEYGNYKWAGGSIGVDLRTNPNSATGQTISTTTTESTMYKKVAFANNHYFLPDGSAVARVKWSAGSGKLGEAISYELYVAYGSGGWQKLADLASGTTYYNHQIPKQTVSQQFKYLIRTITGYGYYSDAVTSAETLHFYNQPGLAQGAITRGATTADVKVTVKTNSSIPNISTTGSWKMSTTNQAGNLTASQTEQTIATTGLTDNGTYTLAVTYNDNTGFSSNQVVNIAVGANLPLFFVNKYGAGVNGAKASSQYSLLVSGTANADNITVGGNNVYHTGRKPTAADVGAVPTSRTVNGKALSANITLAKGDVGLGSVNNWGASSTISSNSTSQYATTNMVAQVRAEKADAHSHPYLSTSGGDISGNLNIKGTGGCSITGNVSASNLRSGGLTRIDNANTITVSGMYSFSGGTGMPTTYGTLINMMWADSGDRYQIAMGSNNTFYVRRYTTNSGWAAWKAW